MGLFTRHKKIDHPDIAHHYHYRAGEEFNSGTGNLTPIPDHLDPLIMIEGPGMMAGAMQLTARPHFVTAPAAPMLDIGELTDTPVIQPVMSIAGGRK